MRPRIAFLVIALAIALFVPAATSASGQYAETPAPFTSCVKETTVRTGPYGLKYQVTDNLEHIRVRGSAFGRFTGTCRGFATGTIIVTVKQRDGDIVKKARRYRDREFKNGYLDSGKPFKFFFMRRIPKLDFGDCVRVQMRWAWRFQNNEKPKDSFDRKSTGFSCV